MKKSVEYYLSKGLDRKMAEYFAAGRKKIVDVAPNDDFTLTICFDNGEKMLYDVRPLLKKARSLSRSQTRRIPAGFTLTSSTALRGTLILP